MRWSTAAAVLLTVVVASLALNIYQYSSPRSVTVTTTSTKTTTTVMPVNESSSPACAGVAGQFLEEGLYSQFGYPKISYDTSGPYWISTPDGYLFQLGTMQTPLMNLCGALGIAVSTLHLDPSNYTLAVAGVSDGSTNDGVVSEPPGWIFFFARTYQGFWLDGTVGNVTDNGGFSASIGVDAINGTTDTPYFDLSSLPASGEHYSLTFNASQALQILRQSNESVIPHSLAVGGTVTSIFPRIALLGNPADNSSYFGPVLNASISGQKRLCWIIHLRSYSYQGYFGVDAETGQILVAKVGPTHPSQSPGTRTVYFSGPFAAIDYQDSQNITVAQQSFRANGSILGIGGVFPVTVPNVIIVAPGSSGSVEVNVTDECPRGYPCPSDATLSAVPLPPGVSVSFSPKSSHWRLTKQCRT